METPGCLYIITYDLFGEVRDVLTYENDFGQGELFKMLIVGLY